MFEKGQPQQERDRYCAWVGEKWLDRAFEPSGFEATLGCATG